MPEQLKCRYSFITALKNTSKPICATPDEDFFSVEDIIALAQELAGGKEAGLFEKMKKFPNKRGRHEGEVAAKYIYKF